MTNNSFEVLLEYLFDFLRFLCIFTVSNTGKKLHLTPVFHAKGYFISATHSHGVR
jgi:hypothetical protein